MWILTGKAAEQVACFKHAGYSESEPSHLKAQLLVLNQLGKHIATSPLTIFSLPKNGGDQR